MEFTLFIRLKSHEMGMCSETIADSSTSDSSSTTTSDDSGSSSTVITRAVPRFTKEVKLLTFIICNR